ncbi:hypothetical protein P7B02_10930 [Caulobacter segnis]|nr:hypothetical protein [Caulobacter segnis]MDG2522052.1 hypothetical protein [Caulobacter segnis]
MPETRSGFNPTPKLRSVEDEVSRMKQVHAVPQQRYLCALVSENRISPKLRLFVSEMTHDVVERPSVGDPGQIDLFTSPIEGTAEVINRRQTIRADTENVVAGASAEDVHTLSAIEVVVPPVGEDVVITVAGDDDVSALTATDEAELAGALLEDDDRVVTVLAAHDDGFTAADHKVMTSAAGYRSAANTANQSVITSIAVDVEDSLASLDDVVTVSAVERVPPITAINEVVTAIAANDIISAASKDGLIQGRPDQPVSLIGSEYDFHVLCLHNASHEALENKDIDSNNAYISKHKA